MKTLITLLAALLMSLSTFSSTPPKSEITFVITDTHITITCTYNETVRIKFVDDQGKDIIINKGRKMHGGKAVSFPISLQKGRYTMYIQTVSKKLLKKDYIQL